MLDEVKIPDERHAGSVTICATVPWKPPGRAT